MHLLVPRSRSSAKVKVKYKGFISQKMAVSGAFVFHKHTLIFEVVVFLVEYMHINMFESSHTFFYITYRNNFISEI